MSFALNARISVGSLTMSVALDARPGEVIAVLGPNGAGKTTLLRALAGLHGIDEGTLSLDDECWDDPSVHRFVRPEHRAVGVVFQQYLLFEHLTALDNVAFGLRARGASKHAARAEAATWLGLVGLSEFARTRPSQLSGGQAQRVALARALATRPALLLLDEPLSALDASTRPTVRRELAQYLRGYAGVCVLVTHDPLDALALADRICVIENGRVTQFDTVAEVAARPRTHYVADLLGVNLLSGTRNGEVVVSGAATLVVSPAASPAEASTDQATDGEVIALIRPNAIALHRQQPDTSARNVWQLTVSGIDLLGDRVRVLLDGEVSLRAEITAATMVEFGLVEGGSVWASVKATDVEVYRS